MTYYEQPGKPPPAEQLDFSGKKITHEWNASSGWTMVIDSGAYQEVVTAVNSFNTSLQMMSSSYGELLQYTTSAY
jgi:hypothetical protein